MNQLFAFLLALAIPLTAMVGGFVLVGFAMQRRLRLKELAYRERLAMIEKGLMPSPETDPARFERFLHDSPEAGAIDLRARARAGRQRSLGVMLIGLALGVTTVIYFAGNEPDTAFGVGGLIGFIGLAMLVNGLISGRERTLPSAPSTPHPPAATADRPSPGL